MNLMFHQRLMRLKMTFCTYFTFPATAIDQGQGANDNRKGLASVDDEHGPSSRSALRVGDRVSLFALEAFGFLRADGFVNDGLIVDPLDYQDPCPLLFEACLFQIEPKRNYFKQQAFKTFITQNGLKNASDFELLPPDKAQLVRKLQAEAELEVARNAEDEHFYQGRVIKYGQAFQLRHVITNKFLSVNFGANLTDVLGTADAELSNGSMSCYFRYELAGTDTAPGVLHREGVLLGWCPCKTVTRCDHMH
jgi:hypothetical protein